MQHLMPLWAPKHSFCELCSSVVELKQVSTLVMLLTSNYFHYLHLKIVTSANCFVSFYMAKVKFCFLICYSGFRIRKTVGEQLDRTEDVSSTGGFSSFATIMFWKMYKVSYLTLTYMMYIHVDTKNPLNMFSNYKWTDEIDMWMHSAEFGDAFF